MTRFAVMAFAIAFALGIVACGPKPRQIAAPSPAAATSTPATSTPAASTPAATPAAILGTTSGDTPEPGVLSPRVTALPGHAIPALATRAARIAAAEQAEPPILLLAESLDTRQQLAQDLAVRDTRVAAGVRDAESGKPLRAEVLSVEPMRASDVAEATAVCGTATCYRVEIYNHARHAATVAIVDVTNRNVVAVNDYSGLQPDIPPHLVALAEDLAVHAPEVQQALGYQPETAAAMMAGTKTALNGTTCERSKHLCVAPTFVQGERALWAIVDLTDGVLVGTRWTALGKSGTGPVVTEKGLQDDVVTTLYCERETHLARGDWAMTYILTSSDGLRVSDVTYKGAPVLDDAKLVDWHVSYSGTYDFGYSDAIGCPLFSQAAVVAHTGPSVDDIVADGEVVGFAVTQNFIGDDWPMPCNYYYRQRFELYTDGRFRIVAGNVGRGCGTDGTYRPVLRIALAGARNSIARWVDGQWRALAEEGFHLQRPDTAYSPEGYLYRISDEAGRGYYVEPGRGQFGDGGRGDNAYTYVTRSKPGVDEGHGDLITIGPCCNNDHRQGPERFIEPEPDPIAHSPLVLWYVPQMTNDDTPGSSYCWAEGTLRDGVYTAAEYPCYAGPMFVPTAR